MGGTPARVLDKLEQNGVCDPGQAGPALLAAFLSLAACAHSPESIVLTLDAAPPAPAAVRADYRGPPVAVAAVRVPTVMDRTEFVRQAGGGQVKVDDFARWGAPPGLLARDALIRDLTARLPAGAVLPPGAAAARGTVALGVTILSFGAAPEGMRMDVAWRRLPDGPVRELTLAAPGGGETGPAAARAFGDLLGRLADRIARDLPG